MGFFNFIETFFFISLGITFILILLLVYHFKQRVCTLEQKGTTMFEIVNGVVKELTNIKRMVMQNSMGSMPMSMPMSSPDVNPYSKTNPAILLKPEDLYNTIAPIYPANANDVSEYDESSDEDDYTESDEEGSYDEDGLADADADEDNVPESTGVDTTDNIKIINYNDVIENVDTLEPIENMDSQESELSSEDEVSNENELTVNEVVDTPVVIKLDNDEITETMDEIIETVENMDVIEEEHIEEAVIDEIEQPPVSSFVKEKEESYKRMNVNQLKAVVVSKGIATDTTKLKKNDLIKLLTLHQDNNL
jgi:hypothetical protein